MSVSFHTPQTLLTAIDSGASTPDHVEEFAEDSPEGIILREIVRLHIADRIALR